MDKKVYSVRDVAEQLGIGISKAYDLVHQKEIPSVRMGKKIIIPKKAFDSWLDSICLKEN